MFSNYFSAYLKHVRETSKNHQVMKMLMRLDLYLWNHLLPKINAGFFRNKFNTVLAMAYVSLYRLPRKFLLNYFFGKGNEMVVNSKDVIIRNPLVLNNLKDALQSDIKQGRVGGSLPVSQVIVYDPNYKYSLGSFLINYLLVGETVVVSVQSDYRFQQDPERLTKYLHNWLFALNNKGKSSDFKITGNDWITNLNELSTINADKSIHGNPRLNLLV